MTQTIEYVVSVNANQAKGVIADIEKRFDNAAKPSSAFGLNLTDINQQMKDMASKMGPAAAAISSVSASLGAAGGEAGKLVAAGGQIVAAFAAGGPIGAAIVATTTVVDVFSQHLKDIEKAREAAFEKNFSQQNDNLLTIYKRTQDLNTELRNLQKELQYVGVASSDVAIIDMQMEAMAKRTEARRLENVALSPMEMSWEDRVKARKEARALEVEADKLDQAVNTKMEIRRQQEDEDRRKRQKEQAKRDAEDLANTRYQLYLAELDAEDKALRDVAAARKADREKIAREEAAALADSFKQMDDDRREMELAEKERTDRLEREAKERARIREEEAAHAAQVREQEVQALQQMGSQAAAALGTFAAEAAMGQEDALQNLLSAASQQAGGMIMLKGGEVMATGIAGMLVAPNPASAAQIAGGAAIVAAGAAVQTGGPAAISALMGAAGKGSGSTSPTGATRDPGASPRRMGGDSGGGGPLVVNVSYGAGGPLPEDIAREINRVVSSGNRRRGAA